ncbi:MULTISPECIES: hypothetical protein [unclassified Sphingomonas]|uniref:hypothetical protein n=1 Tax=unclassified Sphingomonas TaxID=196159 RepID=UPI0006F45CF4|nr:MULTISPECIES: hypothetical protein [unclassified Sphingomonas]KQX26072.1 hypothetical protein ASD17_01005 [Sphingomonas sp. Root1294]KQY69139.1 hypothetical protein ASD39_02200 [Sphingomonas sp. Root50]KRB89393.1 hypothetical protein ASE22_17115 [Sphingomonas sp. Root720]
MIVSGCTAQPDNSADSSHRRSFRPAGDYVHRLSGVHFPRSVGRLQLVEITEYDSKASDVGVGYNVFQRDLQAAFTVYVYPAPDIVSIGSPRNVIRQTRNTFCERELQGIEQSIESAHPQMRLVAHGEIASPSSNFEGPGRRLVYRGTDVFAGRQQAVRSEADLFCYVGGKWLISFRTTARASDEYRDQLDLLMRSIAWPAE